MFTHILVPTDFSEPSDSALEYARVLAAKFGASLHLLHVVEGPLASGPFGTEVFVTQPAALERELFENAKAKLEHRRISAMHPGQNAATEIVGGVTARAIVDYAVSRGMDLIVMGTHGRSGLPHLVMGSVAEKVVRHARCPVLTVRGLGLQTELVDAVPDLVAVNAQ